jgi:hypothetical protein
MREIECYPMVHLFHAFWPFRDFRIIFHAFLAVIIRPHDISCFLASVRVEFLMIFYVF